MQYSIVTGFQVTRANTPSLFLLSKNIECYSFVQGMCNGSLLFPAIYCSFASRLFFSALYIMSRPIYLLFKLKSASYSKIVCNLSTLNLPVVFYNITFIPCLHRFGEYPDKSRILAMDVLSQLMIGSMLQHFQWPIWEPDGLEDIHSFTLFHPCLCSSQFMGTGCLLIGAAYTLSY